VYCRCLIEFVLEEKNPFEGENDNAVPTIFTRSRVWTKQTFLFSCSQHGTTFSKYPNNATHVWTMISDQQATLSRTFRLNCLPHEAILVESLLQAQGFIFENDPCYLMARRLISGPTALGNSLYMGQNTLRQLRTIQRNQNLVIHLASFQNLLKAPRMLQFPH